MGLSLGSHGTCRASLKRYNHDTTDKLSIMGLDSGEIIVERGTRQGCPCSPVLFALYRDPYIQKLLADANISPVTIQGLQTKLLSCADDVAVVTTNPSNDLLAVENAARKFGLVSWYKLNTYKTQILRNQHCKVVTQWDVQEAVYLEIKLTTKTEKIIPINFDPLVKKNCYQVKKS